jgi:hypothetical protein
VRVLLNRVCVLVSVLKHLGLFEFVGRMLGKAVYDGIVVEVC